MKSKLLIAWILGILAANMVGMAQVKPVLKFPAGITPANFHQAPVVSNSPTSCTTDTIILTTQAQIDNFTTNYPTCTTPKYILIDGMGASPAITSLAGLSTITQVINKLEIKNTSITSLSQLTGLTQIGDTLLLERNNSLTNIGLNNLTALGAIYFSHLPALSSVAGLCNNFHKTGLVYIDSTNLSNLTGLHTLDTLTTGNGGLTISYSPIVNLAALNNLEKMEGYLKLSNNSLQTSIGLTNIKGFWGFLFDGMPLLNSVSGLTGNLTNGNIGTFWFFNTGIASLAGLEGMTGSSNFYISGNNNLASLNGLQNLSGSIYGFSLWGNAVLNNISALNGITNINDGTIEIAYNNNLASLNGLQNITNIDKGLWIYGNDNLTTLNDLNNNLVIQNLPDSYSGGKDSVRIFDNTQLALCSDTSICNYLSGGGTAEIYNNATGCNTIAEIQASCGPGINYNDPEDNCCTYNAIPIIQNQIKNGNVGHYIGVDGNGDPLYDDYDTYRIIMPYDGAFRLFFTAKNDSSCHEATSTNLNAEILDENGNSPQYSNLFDWNFADPCNTVKTDSFKFRGYAADTFYIRLAGNKISYSFYWQAMDSTSTDEGDNDDITTSFLINPMQIKKGHVKFKTANHDDQNDYYKIVLPVSANLEVYFKITNRENQTPPNRFSINWGYTAPLGFFTNGNGLAIPAVDEVIYDTIPICALANDTIYFRLTGAQEAYEYEWSYKIKDSLPNDAFEANNSLATAALININQVKQSTIGYVGKLYKDQEDNFVTVLPATGKMKIYVQATSGNCDAGYLYLAGLNKQQNYLFTNYLTGITNIPPQTSFTDSITLCGQPADSFYFKFISSAAFNYQFWYIIDTIPNAPEDPEPNNSFATATPINQGDSVNGRLRFVTVPAVDDNDYYRTVLPYDGTMKIFIKGTPYNCGTSGYINFKVYDKRQAGGNIYFKQIGSSSNLQFGQSIYDTVTLCGLASDTFYIHFHSFQNFIYSFKYQMVDTSANDLEPNNSFATANPHNENELKRGHLGYRSSDYDNYDYYRTVLPKDGTLKMMVKLTNMSCNSGQWVYLRVYDRRQAIGEFYQKYVANNTNILPGETVYDTIYLCGRAADTLYTRFEEYGGFQYEFSYQMIDTSANDAEPNNNFATAIPHNENEIKKGHIKYFSNGGADDLDYYKTLLPKDGMVKIIVQATNLSCGNNQWVYMRFYDKRQGAGEIYQKYLANNASVAAGQTIYDTIYLCGRAADSLYIRYEASSSFKYEFYYQMTDTSGNDIEPNNSFASATGVGSSQIKKGHIKYFSNGVADDYDHYKFIFNSSDSLKLQMQATNKSCSNNQWVYIRVYNKNFTELFSRYFANNSGVANNQTVYDSIRIFVNAPDTIYLRYEASSSFQYQLSTNERLPSVPSISGDSAVCFGPKSYLATNVIDNDVVYHWSLSGGGTLSSVDSSATVNWNTNGTYTLSLYLSNNLGNSPTVTKTIIVNNNPPTEIPVVSNFARTLSTSGIPSGSVCNWYKNGLLIPGITDSIYYAADSGTFTVRFVRPCGTGPVSNSFYFPLPAQAQAISFVHTPNIIMSPLAKSKLNATTSSGLPVNYQWVSGNATVNGDTVYVSSVGTVIVKAVQPGSNIYAAATPKFDTILVVQGSQTITFNHPGNQIYSNSPLPLTSTASSGLTVTYTVISGNAIVTGGNVITTGAGNVTVQANQPGNANYSAAAPVQQTFCIGVRTLSAISGSVSPCLNNYTYTTDKIPDANYVWTLSSGGTITTHNDTAFINWNTTGTHTITVKANSNCDPVYSNIVSLSITTANNPPTPVSNMLPADNAIDQQLPLTLSWLPGAYTVNYDLYVWDSALAQPATPYAANINAVSYTLPQNSLAYNKAYKWRVVSKNPCLFTAGPVQQFRLVPLPDLQVFNVQAPLTAFSGQTIALNWSVKNNGPGRTQLNHTWSDAVFMSFDSLPNFSLPPQTSAAAWNQLDFPLRPLLVGTRLNVSALDSGQQYSNSINFTLPVNYSQNMYVYVITNYPANGNLLQTTISNDTARAPQPIDVTLSPTPDLRVDTILAPASTFSGSTVFVTYKIKNYGVVTPPNTSWGDKFYISPTANFNPANAIELVPESFYNGKYYNNCLPPSYTLPHTTQLNADSTYTNSVPLVIPNFIYGSYFIHVFTNKAGTVYEGALSNNNTNSRQIQVFLTPTPVLDVSTLSLPVTQASTTQPIGVNWNINNGGFFDNIEKKQGHYAKQGAYCANFLIGYTAPPSPQPIYAAGYYYTDSLDWGSSYWNDKIYISRDSGSFNTASLIYLGKFNHGSQINSAPCYDYNNSCLPGGNNDRNLQNVIKPATNYPSAYTFTMPDTLSEGNYYVYVLANADKTVYEYPAINRYKRSGMITVNRPDLVPPTLSVPAAVNAGIPFTFNYTIANNGAGGVYNHLRRDRIYVSTSPVFDGSAQLIGTQSFVENVLTGSPVTHSFQYTFPEATPTSTRYFYVHTNYDSAFKETNLNNNRSVAAAVNVTIAVAKDLFVSSVQLPNNLTDTVFTLNPVLLKYTVANNGADSIAGKTWTDSIFVSCTPAFNANTAYYLGKRVHNNLLTPGQNYSDSLFITIPKFSYELNGCFGVDNTPAYFFVRTNSDSAVYEGANMANNYTASIQKKLINPYIDHIVTTVGGSDSATVARYYSTNWTVKNIKYYTPYSYNSWVDRVYFSPDSVFNANAIWVSGNVEDRRVNTNQTYNTNHSFILPNIPAGDYYVHIKTNADNGIPAEKNVANNSNLVRNITGAAQKIHVSVPLLPDLTDSIVSAPATLPLGQYFQLINQVKNVGSGVTFPNNFATDYFISADFIPSLDDVYYGYRNTNVAINAGQTRNDTLNNLLVPAYLAPGNYVLIARTDVASQIVETNETNNLAFKLVTVYSPAPSDLFVQSVSHPDSVFLGYTLDSLKWMVKNNSPNSAVGSSSDGLYLTTSGVLDSTAMLIGIKNKSINMLPLSTDNLFAQPLVNNVTEGNYKVFVRTDLLNNIVETNKDNNIGSGGGNLYVKVKELPMNVLTPNTLSNVPRYYKLIIPDSLSGSTIQVTLLSNDSLTSTNQLYIGKGFIPNAGHFDYKYDRPNYGNQRIVIDNVTTGTFYIVASKITAVNPTQNISLKAVKLPFTILTVQTNSGGNTGNVTIKISGSLFNNSMTGRLYNGITTIPASAIYYVNSTTVYATFNLAAKPLGIYNVELHKTTDSSNATLFNGFSVVNANNGGLITGGGVNGVPGNGNDPGCDPNAASGLNSQLVTEMVLPDKVFGGWVFVIQINYNNPSNVDIPAQTRVLYCTDGFPVSLTQAGIGMATSSVYLELSESGGPPGIIRAGGSGTINVYSKPAVSFPAHRYAKYILK